MTLGEHKQPWWKSSLRAKYGVTGGVRTGRKESIRGERGGDHVSGIRARRHG